MVQLFLRYMRAVKPYNRRTLIYISPEWSIDRSLKPLKDKRYAFNVIGVDVSEKALRESGMDVVTYYKTKVEDVFEKHGEKAIIVFDDFMDAAPGMEGLLRKLYIRGLRTARHKAWCTRTPAARTRARPCSLASFASFSPAPKSPGSSPFSGTTCT